MDAPRPWTFSRRGRNSIEDAAGRTILCDADWYPIVELAEGDWQLIVDLVNAQARASAPVAECG